MATTSKSVVDTRVLAEPKIFHGQQTNWQDWSFAMRAYLSCLTETMADLLDAAETSPEKIDLGPLPEAAKAEARQLCYILALQCSGSALQVVKGVEKNNGFEAWRRMFQRQEPAAGGRLLSMMAKIMEPVFPSTIEGWEEALNVGERHKKMGDERSRDALQLHQARDPQQERAGGHPHAP